MITHPILQIITKRIISSEKFHGLPELKFEQVWDKYFQEKIQNVSSASYILHQTWNRPRDAIRLLTLAQKTFPNETKFNQNVFDSIRKDYSRESWIELSEELKTSFKSEEIDAIRRLFYGYKANFSLKEIEEHAKNVSSMYSEVEDLLESHKLGSILQSLYRIGFIGNVIDGDRNSRYRFSYRGDDEILLEENITIHRGLRPFLSSYYNS